MLNRYRIFSKLVSLPGFILMLLLAGVMQAGAVDVLFVGGDTGPTSDADAAVMSYLQGRYGADNVDYLSAPSTTTSSPDGYDVVVISSTCSSSDVRGKFHNAVVPVVCWESVLVDNSAAGEFGITSFTSRDTAVDHKIRITGSHAITAGFSVGQVVQICSGSSRVFWSVTPEASGVVHLAEDDGDNSHRYISIVDQGDILMGGTAAPGRRVAFGLKDDTFNALTDDGKQLFGQAVDWAAQGSVILTPPVVVNVAASGVDSNSATVAGAVTENGGTDPTVTLYWGDNDGGTDPLEWDESIDFGPQDDGFSTAVSGLSPERIYYFRSFASHAGGDDWADTSATFTTDPLPNPPLVDNQSATGITYTSADLNGVITSTGGEAPEVVIYYGETDGGTIPENWEESATLGAQAGAFSTEVVALTHGRTYHFRVFAQNAGGGTWAATSASFSTLAYGLPTVETAQASVVTGTAAQVSGAVTATGGDAPTLTLFWGDEDGETTGTAWDESVELGQFSADFSGVLTSLSPVTTYYFRVAAENAAGMVWSGQTRSFTTLEVSALILNEFMASNDGGEANNPNGWWPIANQTPGATEDWIEILNTGTTTLDLGGWHLTDDASQPGKWTFPASTLLAPGGFLVVYASGDNAPDAMGNLHTNFKLSAGGEYLALTRPSLTVASSFGLAGSDYPPQDDDVSYGVHPATGAAVYFSSPTPGAANDENGIVRVADTKFAPGRGYYAAAVNVTISTGTADATIYYTTDGMPPIDSAGNPTSTATIYGGPVAITETTALRAAATMEGLEPTNIDTQSYIVMDIDGSASNGIDPGGLNTPFLTQTKPTGWGGLASGDYNMDTAISTSTAASTGHAGASVAQSMLNGMRDIPTISIAMDRDDFSGSNGIYTNPESINVAGAETFAWERVCSAEYIPAAGDVRSDWGETCGLRVQGGASRLPSKSPKHSLSLRFRADYGAGKLNEDLFPEGPVDSFNVISLRAGFNNSWHHWDASQQSRGSMIRDQWARDTMLSMGHEDAGRGIMVHLFVNGLYWGVHNMCERQDASHHAAYNGTDEDAIDALNGGSAIDGDKTAWNAMETVVAGGNWSEIQQVLDVDTYIDYQIMNRYGGNSDLKTNNNWRAAGGGPFPAGQPTEMVPWKLYSWDAERTLEAPESTTLPVDPAGIRSSLESVDEYNMRFADRLQKHFFNGGALVPDSCAARWMARAAELDRAIIGESARWGDHRKTPAYERDNEWLTEQTRMIGSYFPVRSSNVLSLYQSQGLFPSIDAPVFYVNGIPQHGGEIPSGGILTITAESGTIYYTLDGSDPRLEGGEVNPSAVAISSGQSVTLPSSQLVRTRLLSGGEWSALEESSFYVESLAGAGDLVITELHYRPYEATLAEKSAGLALPVPRSLDDADLFEFVEILNVSAVPVNLEGTRFGNGISFTFGNLVLGAGEYAVVARDADAFALRYPAVPLAGVYDGALDNNGEMLSLVLANGEVAQSFSYNNSGQWPGRSDGEGSSLEIINTAGAAADSENWRASREFNGSPGVAGAGPDQRVVVNEVLTNSESPDLDGFELHNTTSAPIDISGWVLSDQSSQYRSFRIPDGTTIAANGYLWFDEQDFNPTASHAISGYAGVTAAAPTEVTSTSHGLTTGDVITISGYGGIGGYEDTCEITVIDTNSFTIDTPYLDNHATAGSWVAGRPFALSGSRGDELWLLEATVGGSLVGFVDHVDFAAAFPGEALGRWPNGAGTDTLVTMTANTFGSTNAGPVVGPVVISEVMYHPVGTAGDALEFVEIYNTGNSTENLAHWRLRGGADFDFTASHELAPGAALVLVPFDPLLNPSAAAAFRTAYEIDESVLLVGPFSDGPLGDDSGVVRLQRPDQPSASDPDFYPQVTEDEVIYLDSAPWPLGAAGGGDSLHRIDLAGFGKFASSWSSSIATPGYREIDYLVWSESYFGPGSPAGSGPRDDDDHDGATNLMEFFLGMNPLVHDAELLPTGVVIGSEFVFAYTRSMIAGGLSFTVETSPDLIEWTAVEDTVVGTSAFWETREVRIALSGTRMFSRLVVRED